MDGNDSTYTLVSPANLCSVCGDFSDNGAPDVWCCSNCAGVCTVCAGLVDSGIPDDPCCFDCVGAALVLVHRTADLYPWALAHLAPAVARHWKPAERRPPREKLVDVATALLLAAADPAVQRADFRTARLRRWRRWLRDWWEDHVDGPDSATLLRPVLERPGTGLPFRLQRRALESLDESPEDPKTVPLLFDPPAPEPPDEEDAKRLGEPDPDKQIAVALARLSPAERELAEAILASPGRPLTAVAAELRLPYDRAKKRFRRVLERLVS
jgi:hypothetical protein